MNNENQQFNLSKIVLDKIEDQHVTPRSKWYFVIQEGGVWVLGIITTFCGAIAISSILFVFATAPLKFQPVTHDSVIKFWLEFIPVLWIMFFISFIFATDYFFKKTKRGYRYGFVVLTLSSVILSIILGYLGFLIGLGEYFEDTVGRQIPFHASTQMANQRMWSQPARGLLVGEIIDDKSTLRTMGGVMFSLDISQLPEIQKSFVTKGSRIGIIGTTTEPDTFFACAIIPFGDKEFLIQPASFERKELNERTNICKGVRPYERLKNKILMYENQ